MALRYKTVDEKKDLLRVWHRNEMARKNFGLERFTADQNSNKSRGYVPVAHRSRFVVSKPKRLPSPPEKKEKINTKTVPFLLGSRGFPGGLPMGKQMIRV